MMNRKRFIVVFIVLIVAILGVILYFSGIIGSVRKSQPQCVVSGCSGELCVEDTDNSPRMGICIWSDKFNCYKTAKCERQNDGKCGWTATTELNACLR